MRASEVLAGALEFWGEGGERWMKEEIGVLGDDGRAQQACLVGGFGVAIAGTPCYLIDDKLNDVQRASYKRALKYVWDEIEARGLLGEILEKSGGVAVPGFGVVKHQEALDGIRFSPANPTLHNGFAICFNDSVAERFEDVKSVVCGALQRALADEEQEDAKATTQSV